MPQYFLPSLPIFEINQCYQMFPKHLIRANAYVKLHVITFQMSKETSE